MCKETLSRGQADAAIAASDYGHFPFTPREHGTHPGLSACFKRRVVSVSPHYSGGSWGVERVIGVAAGVERVERIPVALVERQPALDPSRQVGVCDEMTAERDQVRVAACDDCLGRIRLEAARRDDATRKSLPECMCRDRPLTFSDDHVALDSRLDDVQAREPVSDFVSCVQTDNLPPNA